MASAKDLSEQDRKLAEQDRNFARGRGDDLYNRSAGRADWESANRGLYQGKADERNSLIENGYTPEEADAILQSGGLDELAYTQAEGDANYLTPEEQAGIKGDPNSRFNYYDPATTDQMQRDAERFQRGAGTQMRADLNSAINPQDLALSEGYAGGVSDQLNATDTGVADTVGDTEANVRGAISRDKLAQDSESAGRVRMTPEQQQDIVTGAGISAGTGYRAAVGTAERQARAAGASPMGVAAYRSRMERDSAGEAGDAMTQARIAANREAADREMGLETNRQAAEQYLASETADNEQQLGASRMGAQERSGARRLAAVGDVEDRRVAGARDISDRQMTAATTSGQADIGNERAIAGQQQDVARYNQDTGTAIQTGVEQAGSDRARDIAGNRQGVSQYNSGQRYQRGMDINTAKSGRAAKVADTRIGAGTSSRDYYGGVANQSNKNAQDEYNRQNDIYGTQTGAMAKATGNSVEATKNYVKAAEQPGTFSKIVAAGMQGAKLATGGGAAKGGVFTEPTTAIIGEDGPEMVVPLDSKKRSPWSRYGEAALKGFAKGGMGGAFGSAAKLYGQDRELNKHDTASVYDNPERDNYIDGIVDKGGMTAGSAVAPPPVQEPPVAPYQKAQAKSAGTDFLAAAGGPTPRIDPVTSPSLVTPPGGEQPAYRAPWGRPQRRQAPRRSQNQPHFYGMQTA